MNYCEVLNPMYLFLFDLWILCFSHVHLIIFLHLDIYYFFYVTIHNPYVQIINVKPFLNVMYLNNLLKVAYQILLSTNHHNLLIMLQHVDIYLHFFHKILDLFHLNTLHFHKSNKILLYLILL